MSVRPGIVRQFPWEKGQTDGDFGWLERNPSGQVENRRAKKLSIPGVCRYNVGEKVTK